MYLSIYLSIYLHNCMQITACKVPNRSTMPRVQRINYGKLWNSWIDAMATSMTWRQRKPARIKWLSSSKCYKEWFFCLFIYLLYKNTFHDWFQRISTKTLNPWNTTQINSSTITYTRSPLWEMSFVSCNTLYKWSINRRSKTINFLKYVRMYCYHQQ